MLDEICRKDPRYSWRSFRDGGIQVIMGSSPLSLIDVAVKSFQVKDARAMESRSRLLQLQEVRAWGAKNGCRVSHIVISNGQVPADSGWRANFDIRDEPLWKVMNKLSISAETFFWSAIRPAADCFINLDILEPL